MHISKESLFLRGSCRIPDDWEPLKTQPLFDPKRLSRHSHDHPPKFDLFAEVSRQHKRDEAGDPLQVIARHIDFAQLARLVDAVIERGDGRKGGRPSYPTEVMVRILVLKRLYNLSREQMQYQFLIVRAISVFACCRTR